MKRSDTIWLRFNIIWIMLLFYSFNSGAQSAAFPGAEGYGKYSTGGRGGEIIYVTNLNNDGPGSLRNACATPGPRIIVFKVAGVIPLQSTIHISDPYITIAGQTAPGDGICLRHAGNEGFGHSLIRVSTHDVVIRYLRLRRGPSMEGECCGDCLGVSDEYGDVYNVMIDHCSMSWATDEIAGTWYNAHDVTFQYCIISEALYNSSHMEDGEFQKHSMGSINGYNSYNVTFYRNLFAHNADRNPFVNTNEGLTATFQLVNNVVYNWIYFASKIGKPDGGLAQVDFIGNYIKPGPDSRTTRYELLLNGTAMNSRVYVEGNIGHHRPEDTESYDEWDIAGVGLTEPAPREFQSVVQFCDLKIPVIPAQNAYDTVLRNAGSNIGMNPDGLLIENRDPVDIRIINDAMEEGPFVARELKNGKTYYGLIDDPSQVGGWPEYSGGNAYYDNDTDGMSDLWEMNNGLDPDDSSDGNLDSDGDGYTNVEEFLNQNPQGALSKLERINPGGNSYWRVNPNPVVNRLLINDRHNSSSYNYELIDMKGGILKIRRKDARGNTELNIESLPPGFYLLKIFNNHKTEVNKIVKLSMPEIR